MGRRTLAEKGPNGSLTFDHDVNPDLDPLDAGDVLYRPEMRGTWERMTELRPPAKFILGAKTYMLINEVREAIQRCGTGRGGSGGIAKGRVSEVTFKGGSHHFPVEMVDRTAEECAKWIGPEVERWSGEEQKWREDVEQRLRDGERIGEEISPWMRTLLKSFAAKSKI